MITQSCEWLRPLDTRKCLSQARKEVLFGTGKSSHFRGGGQALCVPGKNFHFAFAGVANGLLDLWYERRSQTQCVDTQADEQSGGYRIGSCFAADSPVPAVGMSGGWKLGNQAQDGWMKGVLKLRELRVVAIRRKDVLGEVIGPYAKKVDRLS